MKLVPGALFLFSLSMSAFCLAQDIVTTSDLAEPAELTQSTQPAESEQARPTQFELIDNSAIGERIRDLLKKNIAVFNRPVEKINPAELRLIRFSVRREIAGLLATEGYFSPTIRFENKFDNKSENQQTQDHVFVQVRIDLGAPTNVAKVQIEFTGDTVPAGLQQAIQTDWSLPKDALFRDEGWSRAKNQAIESLTEHSYAAARISHSEALIQDQQASLSVLLDSGPAFHIGGLHVQGLNLYQPWLLERYHAPVPGEPYNRAKLLQFQRELQNSPYFSAVTVSIDPNPELAAAVPVNVVVQERQKHDVGLAAGYSSNTGARGEISYQDRDIYGSAYDLKSVLRIEQLRQIGYVDIYLPPKPSGYLDSFGVLFDRSDISGLMTNISSFGAKRTITENAIERRSGLSFVYEQSAVSGGDKTYTKALVASVGRTWRAVNNPFDPRQGYITQMDIGGAAKAALSDQNFVRLYGKYQRWIPVGARDVFILRAEAGYVAARDDGGIPEDYLFRAGGTASVRGYAYQSLGVNEAGGVVGGRILTTASAEYVHWLGDVWGGAAFIDVGDATDRFVDLKMKQGIGIGVRYKTPAGPIGVDLAYGRQAKKVRLDFSIGIAF